MIKALSIGLGLALSFGVASAQSKKPARKKPVHAPASDNKKTDPKSETQPSTAAEPDATSPGGKDGTLPGGKDGTLPGGKDGTLPGARDPKLPATTDGNPPPGTKGDATPPAAKAGGNASDAKPSGPMKTDEKVSTTQALQKSTSNQDYRNVTADDEQVALIAFRQGNAHLNDGFFKKAVEKYREALSHWNHPAIHYNLALALINLDQPIDVFDELTNAMAYGPEPLDDREKFERAKQYMRLVQGQLADIEVSCTKAGAKISVDGKEVFTAPGIYKTKVRVGKHTFYGDKEGYNARVTAPFIGAGETFRIELKLYTAKDLTRYRQKWDRTWMPYTVMGAGALVGLVGGGVELLAHSNYKDFDTAVAKCNMPSMGCAANTPGLLNMRSSGNTKRTIGYIGYGMGGAAIATGAVLAWLNRRQAYLIRPEDLEEETAKKTVEIAPIVSPNMAGAIVQGHF